MCPASAAKRPCWNVATNGYINNTSNASPIPSPLTLKLGDLNYYWVVLNGNNYAENGGQSFSILAVEEAYDNTGRRLPAWEVYPATEGRTAQLAPLRDDPAP